MRQLRRRQFVIAAGVLLAGPTLGLRARQQLEVR
jgi:hypothetical protein